MVYRYEKEQSPIGWYEVGADFKWIRFWMKEKPTRAYVFRAIMDVTQDDIATLNKCGYQHDGFYRYCKQLWDRIRQSESNRHR